MCSGHDSQKFVHTGNIGVSLTQLLVPMSMKYAAFGATAMVSFCSRALSNWARKRLCLGCVLTCCMQHSSELSACIMGPCGGSLFAAPSPFSPSCCLTTCPSTATNRPQPASCTAGYHMQSPCLKKITKTRTKICQSNHALIISQVLLCHGRTSLRCRRHCRRDSNGHLS